MSGSRHTRGRDRRRARGALGLHPLGADAARRGGRPALHDRLARVRRAGRRVGGRRGGGHRRHGGGSIHRDPHRQPPADAEVLDHGAAVVRGGGGAAGPRDPAARSPRHGEQAGGAVCRARGASGRADGRVGSRGRVRRGGRDPARRGRLVRGERHRDRPVAGEGGARSRRLGGPLRPRPSRGRRRSCGTSPSTAARSWTATT